MIISVSVLILAPVASATFATGSVYADESVQETLVNSDNAEINEKGEVFYQNRKVAKIEKMPTPEIDIINDAESVLRGVTTWKLISRQNYRLGQFTSARDLALGLIALLPIGAVGTTVLGATSAWSALKSMNSTDEVYITLEQFSDGSNKRLKYIVYYYSDSNYSNKIHQKEFIQNIR